MRIDIWSDIVCPFCYIGKRKFEGALANFAHKNEVNVVWHSFQLDPGMSSAPGQDIYDYLALLKGQTRDWSKAMHDQLRNMASEVGLEYNFDRVVVANTFDAHRLIQFARSKSRDGNLEERLFKAYFTEGRDIADYDTLSVLAADSGFEKKEVADILTSGDFAENVKQDIDEAARLGCRGVPFFLIDRKFTISGAQPSEIFLSKLEKAYEDKSEN